MGGVLQRRNRVSWICSRLAYNVVKRVIAPTERVWWQRILGEPRVAVGVRVVHGEERLAQSSSTTVTAEEASGGCAKPVDSRPIQSASAFRAGLIVPMNMMPTAIFEALRVLGPTGSVSYPRSS